MPTPSADATTAPSPPRDEVTRRSSGRGLRSPRRARSTSHEAHDRQPSPPSAPSRARGGGPRGHGRDTDHHLCRQRRLLSLDLRGRPPRRRTQTATSARSQALGPISVSQPGRNHENVYADAPHPGAPALGGAAPAAAIIDQPPGALSTTARPIAHQSVPECQTPAGRQGPSARPRPRVRAHHQPPNDHRRNHEAQAQTRHSHHRDWRDWQVHTRQRKRQHRVHLGRRRRPQIMLVNFRLRGI